MKRFLSDDWRDVNLTKSFTLGEFVVSAKHPEIASRIKPTPEQADKLYLLCITALQPIRDVFGPVTITSGLVNEELNTARGSVIKDSQHMFGEAVDFLTPHANPLNVFIWCQSSLKHHGELIYYRKRGHVHIALPSIFVRPDKYIDEGD